MPYRAFAFAQPLRNLLLSQSGRVQSNQFSFAAARSRGFRTSVPTWRSNRRTLLLAML
jgi:hypothetical protein